MPTGQPSHSRYCTPSRVPSLSIASSSVWMSSWRTTVGLIGLPTSTWEAIYFLWDARNHLKEDDGVHVSQDGTRKLATAYLNTHYYLSGKTVDGVHPPAKLTRIRPKNPHSCPQSTGSCPAISQLKTKKEEDTTICLDLLNAQGIRNGSKSFELQELIQAQSLDLLAVTETHLRNDEAVLGSDNIQYIGANHSDDDKNLGGIGVFCCTKLSCQHLNMNCK